MFQTGTEGEDPRDELMRLAKWPILEEALEAKARDLLGRDPYERRSGGASGDRNGYRKAA